MAFSPNGRTILAEGATGPPSSGTSTGGFRFTRRCAHPDAVSSVGFSPDGRYASTVSWDRVYLWDAATGEPLGAPAPHPKEVVVASFGPAGRSILTRSRDFTVRTWQTTPAPTRQRASRSQRLGDRRWRSARRGGESFLTAVGGSDGRVRSWKTTSTRNPSESSKISGRFCLLAYRNRRPDVCRRVP